MFASTKLLRSLSHKALNNYNYTNYGNLYRKSFRNVHSSPILYRKMFLEHENRYAYDVMKNKGYAAGLVAATRKDITCSKEQFDNLLQEDCMKKPTTQLIEEFAMLGLYSSEKELCISNKSFDLFIDSLTDSLHQASDQELRLVFYYLLQWPETESIRTRNFIEVWAALDDECLKRLNSWTFDEMLSFIALFYMINVTRVSDFSRKSLQKMASKAKQLTSDQLVQTMFFIGIMRKSPYDIHNLELQVHKLFNEFTIDELAIISMGFFKSKTPIRNMDLISNIIEKIVEHSKDIHEVSLAALLKIIRYSVKVATDNKIYNLLEALQYEVPRLSTMCNVHLALLGTATLTLHQKCLSEIASVTLCQLSEARMKDLERLVFTYGTFNIVPNTKECFLQKVVEELRKPERSAEIIKHGRSFACCVSYLSHLSIYPTDLMNKVLSPEFLQNTYGKQVMTYGREVLTIHNSAKIFCKETDMNLLSDKYAITLAKKYTDFVPSESFKKQYNVSEKMMLDVLNTLKEFRGGDNYVVGDHIVTHHQRGDVIICNSPNGEPMEVAKHYSSSQFGRLRMPPDENFWVALVIGGRNAIIQNTDFATGPYQAKIRELEALGYNAALVPWSKYSLLDSKETKINYLNELINQAISGNKSKLEIKIS